MSERLATYHQRSQSPYAKKFGRVITAMVTPFHSHNETIDWHDTNNLASHLLANGSDSILLTGTTGESPTLSHEEQRHLFENVRYAVPGTIIAGTGSNSTKEAVSLSNYVTNHRLADGLLVVSPYYNRPSQYGIQEYFHRIASETDLPVIAYNIPTRTGREISDRTLINLAASHDNFIGLKDAAGDTAAVERLIKGGDLPDDFVVYSGDDSRNLELAKAGAVGAISVASHWIGNQLQSMYDALDNEDEATAETVHGNLNKHYDFESSNEAPNPHPTKVLLREAGVIQSDTTRPPLQVHPETRISLARRARTLLS